MPGRPFVGAPGQNSLFNTLSGNVPGAQTIPDIQEILAEREQRRQRSLNPTAFGREEEARGLEQGLSIGQAARLGRTRARGTSGFQNFSRNIDPLTQQHFMDFVDDANRLSAIKAMLDPSRIGGR